MPRYQIFPGHSLSIVTREKSSFPNVFRKNVLRGRMVSIIHGKYLELVKITFTNYIKLVTSYEIFLRAIINKNHPASGGLDIGLVFLKMIKILKYLCSLQLRINQTSSKHQTILYRNHVYIT